MIDQFFKWGMGNSAVALRWATTPDLGFPREPFQIFRRLRNTLETAALTPVVAAPMNLTAQSQILSILPGGDAAYLVVAEITVAAASSVTVQALDVNGDAIPDQIVTRTTTGLAEFRCPGIAALSISWSGTGGSVGPVTAVGETAYANLPDWTQIQTVGLPLLNQEIGNSYHTTPQGFWLTPLTPPAMDGVTAATDRIIITAALQAAPPATGITDFPLPAWPAPVPAAYVADIRAGSNLVPMIERCLENSVDANPSQMQASYTETVTVDGIRQTGVAVSSPDPTTPSLVNLPVTGIAMLAVSTDSFAAVALGYGTVDIPPDTGSTSVSVSIAPASATVAVGKSQQFTATVTGASITNTAVTWSVNGIVGGSAALGTVTAAGLYTAPATVPASIPITLAATSVQDSTKSATVAVTIVLSSPVISVSVAPASATVAVGKSQQFTATVAGAANTAVTWSVNGIVGGSAAVGTVTTAGLYTAPAKVPAATPITPAAAGAPSPSTSTTVVTITATSAQDSTKSATVAVTIVLSSSIVSVGIAPTSATVAVGKSQQFTATVTGAQNTAVTWSVNGIVGGSAALGTVTTAGLYTAPATVPAPTPNTLAAARAPSPSISAAVVTLAATSVQDSTKSATVAVTIVLSSPVVSVRVAPASATVAVGKSQQFTATVTGAQNTAVTWSVNGIVGGSAALGTVTTAGLYTAPAKIPAATPIAPAATGFQSQSLSATVVTLAATSVQDSTKSATVAVTIVLSLPPITLAATSAQGAIKSAAVSATAVLSQPVTPIVSVSIAPAGATVAVGKSQQFTATVTGALNTAVAWSVNGIVGGSAAVGTVTTAGLYTAPATVPASTPITLTATSAQDSSKSATVAVTIVLSLPVTPIVSVSIAPASATVAVGKSQQFTATVATAPGPANINTAVTWSVNGVVGGSVALGTVTTAGHYTAPATVPASTSITLSATSVLDSSKSAAVPVTIVLASPIVSVSVTPSSATVAVGKSQQFAATLTGTAITNATVSWSVNGIVGGNAALGTVTTAGLYTAPAAIPASTPITLTATSAQDPRQSAAVPITIVLAAAPVPLLPQVDAYGDYDYMVTAPFTIPSQSAGNLSVGLSTTLAALSTGQPPVAPPAALSSALSQVYAPLHRDQLVPAAIRVSWQASSIPQGYGILASRAPNQSEILNASRPAAVHGYYVFVGLAPTNPDPNTPPDQQNPGFSDTQCALPLLPHTSPDVTNRYLVAAQDIFGQWSNWVETSTALSPAPVTKPGLRNAEFILAASSPPTPVVSATLRIDFGWDWQDRAPGQIRFTGQFVPAPATTLNPPYLGGFAMKNSGPIGPPVVLTFNYGSLNPDTVDPNAIVPVIDSQHTSAGPVMILAEGSPPTPAPNPLQVQYRVDITGLQLDFSAADELDFVIYATATEEIRPGVWSDPSDAASSLFIGKIVRALDPNPPTVLFAPPPISWTALPDATGVARGVLEWTADPRAAGYFVWEATESALQHILPGGSPDPPADTPYVTRAATIIDLLNNNQDTSLQGFARLTQDPIAGNRTEIAIPGSASTLYLYRISAISANNVEAARSEQIAVFGVPRRNVPGTPRIMLRSVTSSPGGIQVIVLSVESGAMPSGFRLFRVRNQLLSQDGFTMGPAKIDESSADWEDYSSTTLAGKLLSGKSVVDTAAIQSWYPYYYRATAVGAQDLANGLYSGESGFSSTQAGYVLPPSPPMIGSFQVSISSGAALITLVTDLPVAAASPVGPALVELLQLVRLGVGPLELQQLLASAPDQIAMGSVSPPSSPPSTFHGELRSSIPDGNGHWTLQILIPYSAGEQRTFVVRLTDPLARQSSTFF
jgi:hypothetical protein